MSDVRLVTEGERELKPLVQAALANELKLIEAGIRQTERRLEDYEKQYGISTQEFVSSYENDERGESMEFAEWIGEFRLLMRLQEKAETHSGISALRIEEYFLLVQKMVERSPIVRLSNVDAFVKSRHPGENRGPEGSQVPIDTGFRLSPE